MLIEQMLDRYFKGQLSLEEMERLFREISMDPSLEDTILTLSKDIDPEKVQQFLSEKSLLLMCDKDVIPKADETQIDMFLSGMMSEDEEAEFKERLLSDAAFQTNALARAFLFMAIKKIHQQDAEILDSAGQLRASDITNLLERMCSENDDELIDMYLKDQLPNDKKKAFESRMTSDVDFKERVMAVVMLNRGINELRKNDLMVLGDAPKLSREDVISVIERERTAAAAVAGTVSIWTKIRRVAAVAAVVASIYDFSNSSSMRGLAGENIQYAMSGVSAPSRGGISEAEGKVLNELKSLFECAGNKDCVNESTVSRLRMYYDMVTDDAVDFEDAYIDQISLAMATTYIYTGHKSNAKEVLRETIDNPDVSGDARSRAEKLLKKATRSFVF